MYASIKRRWGQLFPLSFYYTRYTMSSSGCIYPSQTTSLILSDYQLIFVLLLSAWLNSDLHSAECLTISSIVRLYSDITKRSYKCQTLFSPTCQTKICTCLGYVLFLSCAYIQFFIRPLLDNSQHICMNNYFFPSSLIKVHVHCNMFQ